MNGKLIALSLIFLVVGIGVGYGLVYTIYQPQILRLESEVSNLQSEVLTLTTDYTNLNTTYTELEANYSLLIESMDIHFLRMGSGSMEPTLHKDDLIIVQGVLDACEIKVGPKGSAEPGDIIVFHKPTDPSELIVHRAIDKELRGGMWYFQTKGDANSGADNWDSDWKTDCDLAENYVIGKVVAIISEPS